jgi:DNA repair protein RecO (recombination protein O)
LHGEHGAIVRVLTEEAGLVAGYVRGGHSSRMRPILMPGNVVQAELRTKDTGQLGSLTVELVHSRGPLLSEPLPAIAIEWSCSLAAATLPEAQPFPALHGAMTALLDAVEAAPAAWGWAVALVHFERLLLAELGFGLDLSRCAVTGEQDDLVFVSPSTGRAVSRTGGQGYEARLLKLPPFLLTGGLPGWPDILDGLALTGHFLARNVVPEQRRGLLDTRERLLQRLKRAIA